MLITDFGVGFRKYRPFCLERIVLPQKAKDSRFGLLGKIGEYGGIETLILLVIHHCSRYGYKVLTPESNEAVERSEGFISRTLARSRRFGRRVCRSNRATIHIQCLFSRRNSIGDCVFKRSLVVRLKLFGRLAVLVSSSVLQILNQLLQLTRWHGQ